ncbi:hydrogenase maturation nickel metallochaperone HypA [Actinomadura viridis]|uniref:hydrogenase maturation nickel metallochaperone HypA/HybF n=1 Tax=Actinomadura viridis TaxID=58110 RepID=UPI0036A0FF0B
MHELGLCEAIVQAAVKRADGRRVHGARVRVGGHPVDPEVVEQGFRLAAAGTVVEGAELDLVLEPLSVRCRACGTEAPASDATALTACSRCGAVDIEVTGRDDVVLESITVDAPGQDQDPDNDPERQQGDQREDDRPLGGRS